MSQNDNSPRFDISTALPVGVGVISLFGICLLLIANRLAAPRAIVEVPDTATPFHYLFLGTEPGISSPVPSEIGTRPVGFAITAQSGVSVIDGKTVTPASTQQQRPTRIVTRTPTDVSPVSTLSTSTQGSSFPTPFPTTGSITNTPITLPTVSGPTATLAPAATRTITPTSISAPPLNAGTYDDTDSHLVYGGFWVSQTGQPGAEGGTLHVSSTLNSTVTFRFIGDQLRIIYQSGSGLGTMIATIDGETFTLNQTGAPSTRSEWAITDLTIGTHNVTLTHQSGGSVNIDQVIVPDITPTATPTATATSTP